MFCLGKMCCISGFNFAEALATGPKIDSKPVSKQIWLKEKRKTIIYNKI